MEHNVAGNNIYLTARRRRGDCIYNAIGDPRDAYSYPTRMDCYQALLSGLIKIYPSKISDYIPSVNYTTIYNSWLMASGYTFASDKGKNWAKNGSRDEHYERIRFVRWITDEGPVELTACGFSNVMKDANNRSCYKMFSELRRKANLKFESTESNQTQVVKTRTQMDKTTEQGEATQDSDKQVNTIITRDQEESSSKHSVALDSCTSIASSEPSHRFPTITKRWMPLDTIEWLTSHKDSDIIKVIFLPESLYMDSCTPNLNPFESFYFGRMDIELRIVINGNKFCCGKLLMSSKYDSYQNDALHTTVTSACIRPHVIIDASGNNEGVLQVPFRFHRPWIRLIHNDQSSIGMRPSKYASVYLHVLSPLATGPSGPASINGRIFFRFKSSEYTGMSYRVAVAQMIGLENIVTQPTARALKEVLAGAERAFDQIGRSRNQDKPGDISSSVIVPHPRLNFAGGKGVTDVIPLRINPHTLTNYDKINCPSDEPRNFFDLARIWSPYKVSTWKTTDGEGSSIVDFVVDPCARSYTDDVSNELTTLEYACSNFAFWTGTIEVRLDFVSNSFHTGAVQLSAEFGRKTSTSNMCESSSTYAKTFHLGDQKSVTFVIPYIYDTVMRRTTSGFFNPYMEQATSDNIKYRSLCVAPESHTRFKVRVMNALRPPANAPQQIDILIFWRAGANFRMHGLKGSSAILYPTVKMDKFPEDNYTPDNALVRTKRIDGTPIKKKERPADLNKWGEFKSDKIPAKFLSSNVPATVPTVAPHKPEDITVQMDNGEKEDQDTTDNFNQGASTVSLLTSDCHMDFKDLLRRPTLILWQQRATTMTNGAYFIPLMPPNINMCMTRENEYNNIWTPTIGQTTAANINSMFGAWRGGMRYTIVIVKCIQPVYVGLIPHSGVRIMGNHDFCENTLSMPICGANFITEIIAPGVNPVVTIEAPYETENTWTKMMEEDSQRNYAWSDKGDFNSGHLFIKAHTEVVFDVWWHAADDFELANFYGTPLTLNTSVRYRFNDEHARVQMDSVKDFLKNEAMTTVTSFKDNVLTGRNAMRAIMGSVPVVGTSLVMADVAGSVEQRIIDTTDEAKNTFASVRDTADKIGVATENLSVMLREVVERVCGMAGNVITNTTLLCDMLLDLLAAWMEKSWRIVGIALVRFISKVFVVSENVLEVIMGFATQFSSFISRIFTTQTAQVQVDVDDGFVYVGILTGLIGTITGVALEPSRVGHSFTREFFTRLTRSTGMAYFVHVMNFVKTTFGTMRDLLMKALGYVSPEAEALKMLSTSNKDLEKFIREAQIITSESNSGMLSLPRYRRRFWYTVLQAHQIQRLMCRIPTNCVSFQLSKLCTDVIKMSNEKFLDLSASPVRFEPMVICLEGPAGVGKSHMTETLVDRLLEAINFKANVSEKVFYRTAGEKFWSGYRDQPVVIYDEWLNTTDPMRSIDQIAELMKLKSTALFIPEMAHLEEKKVRGNPLIIVICCNNAFPNNISDYATCPSAVLRRREVVFRVERTPAFANKDLRTLSEEDRIKTDNYEHLQFTKYGDVSKKESLMQGAKSYAAMSQWLTNQWKVYYNHETKQVRKRMERLPQYLESVTDNLKVQDPFTLFYQLGVKVDQDVETSINGFTHYEMLEGALQAVHTAISAPLVISEIPTAPLIPWSEVTEHVPVEQGITDMLLGTLIYGWVPSLIAKASIPQLLKWEEQLIPLRTQVGQCSVCLEDINCAYTCMNTKDTEVKHLLCVQCYISNASYGPNKCPVCRCEVLIPLLGRVELSTISVWTRLAVGGVRSLKWVCDKFIAFFNWRRDHFFIGLLTEHLLSMAYLFCNTRAFGVEEGVNSYAALGNSLTINRMAYMSTHIGETARHVFDEVSTWVMGSDVYRDTMTQMDQDDWGDISLDNNMVNVQLDRTDEFTMVPNRNVIEGYTVPKGESRPCAHSKVFQQVTTAKIIGDKWRLQDRESCVIIDVPLQACKENCYINTFPDPVNEYYRVFDHYLSIHQRTIRQGAINYYNNPTEETRLIIPLVYRADWMGEPKVHYLDSWWEYLSEQWSNYKTAIMYCGTGMAVLTALYGAYKMTMGIVASTAALSQVSATAGSAEPGARNPRRTITRTGTQRVIHFQDSVENPTMYEVVSKYIMQNTFQLDIMIGTKKKTMYGTGLFNHYILMPKHYVKEIRARVGSEGHKLFGFPVMQPQLRSEIMLDFTSIIESPHTDLAYIQIPPKYPLFKDIRKFFAIDKDFETPITSEGVLLLNPKGSPTGLMREHDVDIDGFTQDLPVLDQTDTRFIVKEAIQYNYSQSGICGSLLLRENHQRPILSMHFAGDPGPTGKGYGVPLTQESLGRLCSMAGVPVQFEDVCYNSIENAKIVYEDPIHLTYYGSVSKEKTPYTPSKSKLVPSLIHGVAGLTTIMEPAILDAKDPRYVHKETPLFAGVKKHGVITNDFDPKVVRKAKELYWDIYLSSMKPLCADPRELTDEQCVVGLDLPHYTKMDLTTSAGYPYNLNKQRTLKQHYIIPKRNDQNEIIGVEQWDPMLLEIMQNKRVLRSKGIVPHTLFCDTLKDEKRKRDKARSLGGTRVFCSSPVDYVIECRRFFMHFVATFMENRHDLLHAVGINPTGPEWTRLVKQLVKKNTKLGTIDYSNFGPGFNSSVAQAAYELIVRWTMQHVRSLSGNQLSETELWCVVYECLQSMHICNNTVYQQGAGSPSGAFFTTIINTMVNILYIMIAWIILTDDINMDKTLYGTLFKNNVALYCYGDDGIFSVTPEYEDIFNMSTITNLFAQYNIVATNAAKTTEIVPWEGITSANFLKRGFKPHPNVADRWMAPLAWESIVSSTQWVWKTENMKEATFINASAAVMEAYHHGPEIFNDFKQQVNNALKKKKIPLVTGLWEDYESIFINEGFEFYLDDFILQHMRLI